MNRNETAAWIRIAIGTFVAGSEVVDIFIDERSFTVDHFVLGCALLSTQPLQPFIDAIKKKIT